MRLNVCKKLALGTVPAFCALGALTTQADVIDHFDHAAGGLDNVISGTGWTSSWRNNYSRNSGNFVLDGTGLEHANLDGETGGKAMSPSDGTRFQRDLDQSYSTGTVYVSFLAQTTGTTVDPYSSFELQSGADADSGRVFQIGLLKNDDGNLNGGTEDAYAIASRNGVGSSLGETALVGTRNNDVNLFVLRFDLEADTASVFYNPDASVDLTTGGDASINLFSGFSFDRVAIANFTNPGDNDAQIAIDEIRVGTTAPTLVPEPASLGLIALGGAAVFTRRRRAH